MTTGKEQREACKAAKSTSKVSSKSKIYWESLDNTALIFPSIAGENASSVFRISVTLKEDIVRERLQEALDILLPKMSGFNNCIQSGVFWYYLETNYRKAPKVEEEKFFPCRYIHPKTNNHYLFRVTYYKQRINLEVFHAIADGMGAINFLKELTYQYLRLTHEELRTDKGDALSAGTSLCREDSFVRNYRGAKKNGFKRERALTIRQRKLPSGEFGVMHLHMSLKSLKEVARSYKTSLNEYLVAVFIWSVYREVLRASSAKKPIRVAVPVNLRSLFNSDTTKNFFVMVSAEFHAAAESYSFEEILVAVQESLRSQMEPNHLEDLFSYSVSNQKNIGLRVAPLFLKSIVMRAVYNKSALANTATITNVGNVRVDEKYQPFVDNFTAFIAMSKGQNLKGTICSYEDNLTFTFTSTFAETTLQKTFCQRLVEDGIQIELETNGVYYE